jgi:hypothetical protein
MSRKFTVMGFTEAELGFVLAAFFAAVGVAYQVQREEALTQLEQNEVTTKDAIAQRDSALHRLDSIRGLYEKTGKSNLTPVCTEKGEPDRSIAEITVLSADSYSLGGIEMTFGELLQQLQAQVTRQTRLGCRYHVRVVPIQGVDAPVYSQATRRLRSLFYVREG